MSKILISGATGFVGGHLIERLKSISKDQIIGLFHESVPLDSYNIAGAAIHWIHKDIVVDDLEDVLNGIDLVFHLAGYSSVFQDQDTCTLLNNVNVLGTRRIAEAALRQRVSHFVFVSSIAAGEFSNDLVIKESNGMPVSLYGKSKRAAEEALLELSSRGLPVTILRPTALFGENHLGSVYELVRVIKKNRFILIGTGENRTNFYYVKDFVNDLIAVALNSKFQGKVFLASDTPIALRNLVEKIKKLLMIRKKTRSIPICIGRLLGRSGDVLSQLTQRSFSLSLRRVNAMTNDVIYSSERLRTEFNVPISYGLNLGLKNTIDWYKENGFLE